MDDEAAFMALVLANSQSELLPLERGLHALAAKGRANGGRGQKGGLSAYAETIGKHPSLIVREVKAAEVWKTYDHGHGFSPEKIPAARVLAELHVAASWLWPSLVAALIEQRWNVDAAGKNAGQCLTAAEQIQAAPDLPVQAIGKGQAGPGRGKKTAPQQSRFTSYGGSTYLAARLKRDHPEIAAAVERGEIATIKEAIPCRHGPRRASSPGGVIREPGGWTRNGPQAVPGVSPRAENGSRWRRQPAAWGSARGRSGGGSRAAPSRGSPPATPGSWCWSRPGTRPQAAPGTARRTRSTSCARS
jgi:hypothetical protein